ncbi:MAG: hypothetical protein FCSFV1_gp1 [Fushun chilo suppressalis flavivirus 1]|nr:MAG: hypothetical protein FCSFV1_gp1 [Fushun chilo suppressalis flavivirus 1]
MNSNKAVTATNTPTECKQLITSQGKTKNKTRVNNSNATGNEKIYRTKAYTYVECDGSVVRVPGATPVEGVSVIHGPPPARILADISRQNTKSKKITLSTACLVIVALTAICVTPSKSWTISKSNQCFGIKDKCWWLAPGGKRTCQGCKYEDMNEHIVIGSNGNDGKGNKLVWINSTTGQVSGADTIGRLAPFEQGSLLYELYHAKFGIFFSDEVKRIDRTLENMKNVSRANMLLLEKNIKDNHENATNELNRIRSEFDNNHNVFWQHIVDNHESVTHELDKIKKELRGDITLISEKTVEEKAKRDTQVVYLIDTVNNLQSSLSELRDENAKLKSKLEGLNNDLQQLVMDAVNTLMHKPPMVSVDYGVEAATIGPIRGNTIPNKLDKDESKHKIGPIVINYETKKVELTQDVTRFCSCTNGVLRMCNIEIKFNSTRSYKPEESTYCMVKTDENKGVMSKRERLVCKQSEMRDACSLSILVGAPIDTSNASLVKITRDFVFVDTQDFAYKNKLTTDICEFADDSRPYRLTAVSKYRPIFLACNVTVPSNVPARNSNRLHYLITTLSLGATVIIETIYQSWIMGLEVALASIVGFLVAIEDALISDNINARNYAVVIVLICCFTVMTMSRVMSAAVYVVLISWLYTVDAIDGMTFNVVGTMTPHKIIYETSINMHSGDTLMFGNVSLTLVQIRQRKEYDYSYTVPRQIGYVQLCHTWDCTNTAPNCANKCEGNCDGLKYKRCSPMSMYNSCVWSPLGCALCEGTGALFETLCFKAAETCNLFDSPSNQGDREVVINYNIDGRTEQHVVKVGQDAYASGGVFKITQLEILSTEAIGSVAKCGDHVWCRKQKLQLKDFCGWYGMDSNSSQLEHSCLRIKDTRAYADGNAISSKLEYRQNNFEPTQYGFRECTNDEVTDEDTQSAVVWTNSPGARLNIYHEQELDSVTTQLCGDIDGLVVAAVTAGEKHAFKVSTVELGGYVEQECLAYVSSKYCYVLGRNDYLLRSEFSINLTMTCTLWSSDTIYVSGLKRYEVSAANIAVDPNYYVEKAWSVNTNNNTVINGDSPVLAMRWLLGATRWVIGLLTGIGSNLIGVIAICIAIYALLVVKDSRMYIWAAVAVLVAMFAYVKAEGEEIVESNNNMF